MKWIQKNIMINFVSDFGSYLLNERYTYNLYMLREMFISFTIREWIMYDQMNLLCYYYYRNNFVI
jgi:hypothetical protein